MFQSDMSLQITFICETFMTLFALVGHTFMSTSDMCLQMTPLGEIFITVFTLVSHAFMNTFLRTFQ